MQTINVNNDAYLIGLKWFQDDVKHYKKRLKEQGIETGSKYSFIAQHQSEVAYGLIEGDKKPVEPSLLVHLALANKQQSSDLPKWIYVHPLQSSGRSWIGSISNGLPHSEMIVEDYQVTEIIASIVLEFEHEESDLDKKPLINIYTDDSYMHARIDEYIQQMDRSNFQFNAFNKSLKALIDDVAYKAVIKKTEVNYLLWGALGVVACFAVGYLGYSWYEKYEEDQAMLEEEEERVSAERELEIAREKYEKEKQKALEQAKENLRRLINSKLNVPAQHDLIANWTDNLKSINLLPQGWNYKQARCFWDEKETKTLCDLMFVRKDNPSGNVGTVKSIFTHYDFHDVKVDPQGNAAEIRRFSSNISPAIQTELKELSGFSYQDFQLNTLSRIQRMEISSVTKKLETPVTLSVNVELPPPPKGISQDMNIPPLSMGIEEGSIEISGNRLFRLESLGHELKDLEKPLYIHELLLNNQDNKRWLVKGKYYVENGKGNIDTIKIPESVIIKKE